MKILGLAGWSGSGKTTLLTTILPILIKKGLKVSTIKHAHHNFDIDKEGKDSYRHRIAGATEVMVSSGNRFALLKENRDDNEPNLSELIARMTPVDLLLVEGFKFDKIAKIEVYRNELNKKILYEDDENIIAVATDKPKALNHIDIPVLDLNDIADIANFIINWSKNNNE